MDSYSGAIRPEANWCGERLVRMSAVLAAEVAPDSLWLGRQLALSPRWYRQMMRRASAIILVSVALLVSACGGSGSTESNGTSGNKASTGTEATSGSGERIDLDGSTALVWGDGSRGALLAHGAAFDAASWAKQAEEIAAQGSTVLAVEDTGSDGLIAADKYLRDNRKVTDVAFIGGSAGADSMLSLLSEQPDLADQVILLSPNRVVDGLGSQPKLFIASKEEPVANVSTELADKSPGDQNKALILPGSAHAQNMFDSDQADVVMKAILGRLEANR